MKMPSDCSTRARKSSGCTNEKPRLGLGGTGRSRESGDLDRRVTVDMQGGQLMEHTL